MSENLPERIIVTPIDDTEDIHYPEPFDPLALRHDPGASALQMQGRKPRQPTVNEAGEIVGWGMFVLRDSSGDTAD